MKKTVLSIIAILVIATTAVIASNLNSKTQKDCCFKGSPCFYEGSPCSAKK